MAQSDVTFIITAYNEEAVLEPAVRLLQEYVKRLDRHWRIVIVDNGSHDDTAAIGRKLALQPQIEYLLVAQRGRGAAIKAALEQFSGDTYVIVDADVPIELTDIDKLLDPLFQKQAEIVLGRREGARPWRRRTLTKVLRLFTGSLFGLSVRDPQCGAWALTAHAARYAHRSRETGYFLNTELQVRAKQDGARAIDVPIRWIESRFIQRQSKVRFGRDAVGGAVAMLRIAGAVYGRQLWWLTGVGVALLALVATWIYGDVVFAPYGYHLPGHDFTGVELIKRQAGLQLVLWIALLAMVGAALRRLPYQLVLAVLVLGSGLQVLAALAGLPTRSQDSYHDLILARGWVDDHVNPYQVAPIEQPDQSWAGYITRWQTLPLTFGPLYAEGLGGVYAIAHNLSAAQLLLRLLGIAALFATVRLVWHVGECSGISPPRRVIALAVLLGPLTLQNVIIDPHNDVYVGLAITAAYLFTIRKWYVAAIWSLCAGATIKYVAIGLIPIVIGLALREAGMAKKNVLRLAGAVGLAGVVIALLYAPFGYSHDVLAGVGDEATQRGGTNMALISTALILLVFKNILAVRIVGVVSAAIAMAPAFFKLTPLRFVLPLLVLLATGMTWFEPWYILWSLPLVALAAPVWIMVIVLGGWLFLSPDVLMTTAQMSVVQCLTALYVGLIILARRRGLLNLIKLVDTSVTKAHNRV